MICHLNEVQKFRAACSEETACLRQERLTIQEGGCRGNFHAVRTVWTSANKYDSFFMITGLLEILWTMIQANGSSFNA